jgi:hypothetical protein
MEFTKHGSDIIQTDQHNKNFSGLCLAASEAPGGPAERLCHRLAELSVRLDEPHTFFKGQFVRWKPGLKNRKFPDYGEPGVVRAVLPCPIFDPAANEAGSPYFHEPLDLVIAVFRDEDLLEFRLDGRRFEPFAA